MRNAVALMLVASLVSARVGAQSAGSPPELALGIQQVEEGDLDAAVVTLDAAIQRLRGQPGLKKDLALAHVYLSMAYSGLAQPERARSAMRDAWRSDPHLTLDTRRFPPRVIQLLEEVRRETPPPSPSPSPQPPLPTETAAAPASPTPARPSPHPPRSEAEVEKDGGSKKWLLIGGGVAAAAGAAVALGGSLGKCTLGGGSFGFVASTPPPGSTIVVPATGNETLLNVTVSIRVPTDVPDASVSVAVGIGCLQGFASVSLRAGQSQNVSLDLRRGTLGCSSLPIRGTPLTVHLTSAGACEGEDGTLLDQIRYDLTN